MGLRQAAQNSGKPCRNSISGRPASPATAQCSRTPLPSTTQLTISWRISAATNSPHNAWIDVGLPLGDELVDQGVHFEMPGIRFPGIDADDRRIHPSERAQQPLRTGPSAFDLV